MGVIKLSASFDIDVTGSMIGGYAIGEVKIDSPSAPFPRLFSKTPDVIVLPQSYYQDDELKWTDLAYEYYDEGAVFRGLEGPTAPHKLIKLNNKVWLAMAFNAPTSLDNLMPITNCHFYTYDEDSGKYTLFLGGQPLFGNGYVTDTLDLYNYLFFADTYDSDGKYLGLGMYWGAYGRGTGTNEYHIWLDLFKKLATPEPGGAIVRLIPNQVLDLESLIGSSLDVSNSILNSVGNAGTAAWDASQDTIDLP